MSDYTVTPQVVYVDFDGALTDYNGELLTVGDITVEDSGLVREQIDRIISILNTEYAIAGVVFTADRPADDDTGSYSTVYVGKTSDLEEYGDFVGLSETVDVGNLRRDDNAFVLLDSTATESQIAATVAHETGHLTGTLDHGGEGLERYACTFDFNGTLTQTTYDYVLANNSGYGDQLSLNGNDVQFWGIVGPLVILHYKRIDYYSIFEVGNFTPPPCTCQAVVDGYPIGDNSFIPTYHTFRTANNLNVSGFKVRAGGTLSNSTVGSLYVSGADATAKNITVTSYFQAENGAILEDITWLDDPLYSHTSVGRDITITNMRAEGADWLELSGSLTVNQLSMPKGEFKVYNAGETQSLTDIEAGNFCVDIKGSGKIELKNISVLNGGSFGIYAGEGYYYKNAKLENLTLSGAKQYGLVNLGNFSVSGTIRADRKFLSFQGGDVSCNIFMKDLPLTGGAVIAYDQKLSGGNAHFGSLNFSLDNTRNFASEYTLFRYSGLDTLPEDFRPYNSISVSGLPADAKIIERRLDKEFFVYLTIPSPINYDDIVVREKETFDYDMPGNAFSGWSPAEINSYTVEGAPGFVQLDNQDGTFEDVTISALVGELYFGARDFVVKAQKLLEEVTATREFKVQMVVVPEAISGFSHDMTDLVEDSVRHLQKHTASFSYSAPKTKFNLFGLDFSIENAKIGVQNLESQYLLTLNGKFGLELTKKKVTADISGEDANGNKRKLELLVNHDFSGAQFKSINAALSVDKFSLLGFTFSEVSISVDSATKSWAGTGKVKLPGVSFQLGGALGFVNGSFDYLQLGISDINKPIGVTGAFLQSVAGKVANLAPKAEKPVQVEGEIGLTYGPELTIDMPSWLPLEDGDYSLLELTLNGTYSDEAISGKGAAKLLGDFGSASVSGELNLQTGGLSLNGEFSLLNGAISVTGKMEGANGNITISGKGTISIPGYGPLAARKIEGNAVMCVTDNHMMSDDYVMAWGKTTVMGFEMVYGFKLTLDGQFTSLGVKDCAVPAASMPYSNVVAAASATATGSWTLTGNDAMVMFSADWTGTGAVVTLTGPDGKKYTLADITANVNMEVVAELTSDTSICIAVKNAAAGKWTLAVNGVENVSTYVDALLREDTTKPQLLSVTPDAAKRSVAFVYTVSDPQLKSGAGVAIYADTDNAGYDGILVAGSAMNSGSGTATWTLPDGIQGGNYYFYAVTTVNGVAPVYGNYTASATALATVDLKAPEVPEGLQATRTDGGIRLEWSATDNVGVTSYRLRYGATEDLSAAAPVTVAAASTVLTGLADGTFYWQVCALDAAGNVSDYSAVKRFQVPLDPATYAKREVGDALSLNAGENAENIRVVAGGTLTVGENSQAKRVEVAGGGRLIVDAVGRVDFVTVSDGGSAAAYVGAHLADIAVESGATLTTDVGDGWIDTSVVYLDGQLSVAGQLILNKELDASGGSLTLRIGQLQIDQDAPLVVNFERVRRGAVNLSVAADQKTGRYLIADGAGAFTGSITIDDGVHARQAIAIGGSTAINGTTYQLRLEADKLYLTVIGDDRILLYRGATLISGGDNLTGVTIGSTVSVDRMEILSGGAASKATVAAGGTENIQSGGSDTGTTVGNGGQQNVYGTASSGTIGSGGTQRIGSGGKTTGITVQANGSQYVGKGALASGTILNGGIQQVESGGTADKTTVGNGGTATAAAGGTLTALSVLEGGYAAIAGTIKGGKVASGGKIEFKSGAILGGRLEVNGELSTAGAVGAATGAELRFNLEWLLTASEGTALNNINDFNGIALSVRPLDLTYQGYYRLSGTRSTNSRLNMTVYGSGSSALGTVTAGNGSLKYGDYYYTLFNQSSGVYFCVSDQANPLPLGKVTLRSAGIAVDGADQFTGITLGKGLTYDAAEIGNDGVVSKARLNNGGTVHVEYDGSFTDSEILAGGTVTVDRGSTIGGLFIDAGAVLKLTGDTRVTSELTLGGTLVAGGAIDAGIYESYSALTLALDRHKSATATCMVDDWTKLDFEGDINIRVAADQAAGTYRLLGHMGSNDVYAVNVTIVGATKQELLFRDEKLRRGTATYSFDIVNDELVFKVETSDINIDITPSTMMPTNRDVTISATFSGNPVTRQYKLGSGKWTDYTGVITVSANTTVYFKATDGKGQEATAQYTVMNIDKVAPMAPTLSVSTTERTTGPVLVTANFTADVFRKEYSLDGKTWLNYTQAVSVSTNVTFQARGYDAAGNVSQAKYEIKNIVAADPKGPGAVTLTTKVSKYNVTVSWKAPATQDKAKISGYEVEYNGKVSIVKGTGLTLKNLPVSVGNTIRVRAIDSLGRYGAYGKAATFSVKDVTAPTLGKVTAALSGYTGTIAWSGSDNVGIAKYVVTCGKASKTVTSGTSVKFDNLAVGKYNATVQAFDAAGNASKIGKVALTVKDATAPAKITGLTVPVADAKYNATLSWTPGTDNSGKVAGYEIRLDNGKLLKSTKNSLKVTKLSIGSHTYQVRAFDKDKNVGAWSDARSFTVKDVTAPAAVAVKAKVEGNALTLSWTKPKDNVGVTGYILKHGVNLEKTVTLTADKLSFRIDKIAQGNYQYQIVAVDAAGNQSKAKSGKAAIKTALSATAPLNLAPDMLPSLAFASTSTLETQSSLPQLDQTLPEVGALTAYESLLADSALDSLSAGEKKQSSLFAVGF